MIVNIRHKGLKRLYEHRDVSKLPSKMIRKIENILSRLDAAVLVSDMNAPGLGLHSLTGQLSGFWSVRVSGNWRIIFRFEDSKVFDIDFVDYH